jgi:hypothetical protein
VPALYIEALPVSVKELAVLMASVPEEADIDTRGAVADITVTYTDALSCLAEFSEDVTVTVQRQVVPAEALVANIEYMAEYAVVVFGANRHVALYTGPVCKQVHANTRPDENEPPVTLWWSGS